MMKEEKQELVLRLIDGFLSSEERREVELLLLQEEEARLFYENNLLIHHQFANDEVIKAPTSLKNKLKRSLAPQSIFAQTARIKSFKNSLLLSVLILAALFIFIINAVSNNASIGSLQIFSIPFDYVLTIALISGSIAILTYLDKWLTMKTPNRRPV
ncbi:MAG TPA: hypothetical protein PLY70_08500 [Saprospiraceae bacterium]|nr:hypothetical protein [Saprospiraceae bacterium]